MSTIMDVFREVEWTTNDFAVEGQLGTYYHQVMPRSTELTVVEILLNAFKQLGWNSRAASPVNNWNEELHLLSYDWNL